MTSQKGSGQEVTKVVPEQAAEKAKEARTVAELEEQVATLTKENHRLLVALTDAYERLLRIAMPSEPKP